MNFAKTLASKILIIFFMLLYLNPGGLTTEVIEKRDSSQSECTNVHKLFAISLFICACKIISKILIKTDATVVHRKI